MTMEGVSRFSPLQPFLHPDLFFIFSNVLTLGRHVDGIASLYQLASRAASERIRFVVGGVCLVAGLVEVAVVLLPFRHPIRGYFRQLSVAADKCFGLEGAVVHLMAEQSTLAVRANKKMKEKLNEDEYGCHRNARCLKSSFRDTLGGKDLKPLADSSSLRHIKGGISEIIARTSGSFESPMPLEGANAPLPGAALSGEEAGLDGADISLRNRGVESPHAASKAEESKTPRFNDFESRAIAYEKDESISQNRSEVANWGWGSKMKPALGFRV
jgi:hypothetical protein